MQLTRCDNQDTLCFSIPPNAQRVRASINGVPASFTRTGTQVYVRLPRTSGPFTVALVVDAKRLKVRVVE